eukprot:4036323-Karenia_brevis.AAC.1
MDQWMANHGSNHAEIRPPISISSSQTLGDYKRVIAELKRTRTRHSRTFILDSGASLHAISRIDLAKTDIRRIIKREK